MKVIVATKLGDAYEKSLIGQVFVSWDLSLASPHARLTREAIHIRRQPTPLNRDRGSLPDVYDFLIHQ